MSCLSQDKLSVAVIFLQLLFPIIIVFLLGRASSSEAMEAKQKRMVLQHLVLRGITDKRVLHAMLTVPRHLFVPPELAAHAYFDHPLPIGHGQTISQPYIVAYMAEAAQIQESDKVLEIGTGCGYNAAVLSRLASAVHTVEVIPALLQDAQARLQKLGYDNVSCYAANGSVGLVEHAPYDAIIVTAGAPQVPQQLKDQLRNGGRLIIPVYSGVFGEDLMRLTKHGEELQEEKLSAVAFVPLMGKEGWQEMEQQEEEEEEEEL